VKLSGLEAKLTGAHSRERELNRHIRQLKAEVEADSEADMKSKLSSDQFKGLKKAQCLAKQSEAKSHLKALFQAQKSYFAEYDEYSSLDTIGFDPEPGNRYTYCNTPRDCRPCEQGPNSYSGYPRAMCNGVGTTQVGCSIPPNHTGANRAHDRFTACATGNLDDDETVDAWRMNDANMLVNDSNDCDD
jgi:hypothetical protein